MAGTVSSATFEWFLLNSQDNSPVRIKWKSVICAKHYSKHILNIIISYNLITTLSGRNYCYDQMKNYGIERLSKVLKSSQYTFMEVFFCFCFFFLNGTLGLKHLENRKKIKAFYFFYKISIWKLFHPGLHEWPEWTVSLCQMICCHRSENNDHSQVWGRLIAILSRRPLKWIQNWLIIAVISLSMLNYIVTLIKH